MHGGGGKRSKKELDELEELVEAMIEDGDANCESAFDLEGIQRILEMLETARHILEVLLRGEPCPLCRARHAWSGETLGYASTLLKLRVFGETEVVLYLEVTIDDEEELTRMWFTNRTQAERFLARFRDLLNWAEE